LRVQDGKLFLGLRCLVLFNLVLASATGVATFEALDPSSSVDDLLLTGEERVAGAAELDAEFLSGAANFERIPAGARDCGVVVFRMYSWFHSKKTSALICGGQENVPCLFADGKRNRVIHNIMCWIPLS
jgi:hypothetical protein